MKRLALIDLGSNSIRMSVFEIAPGSDPKLIGAYRKMIKLSEGMTEDMCLKPQAQLRAVTALIEYKQIMENLGVTHSRAVATAAVRKAKNGKDFIRSAKEASGITIEIIDGKTEAALDCRAVCGHLELKSGIICDIGGGSCEFIAMTEGKMLTPAISIPIGSRTIFEMFLSEGETSQNVAQATAYVTKHISEIPWLDHMNGAPIIGIGGTLRALGKYHMKDNSNETINRLELSGDEVDRRFSEISSASKTEREKMPGIGCERCDIILGGLLPLMELKELVNSPSLIVADVGIREGLLYEFLESLPENE